MREERKKKKHTLPRKTLLGLFLRRGHGQKRGKQQKPLCPVPTPAVPPRDLCMQHARHSQLILSASRKQKNETKRESITTGRPPPGIGADATIGRRWSSSLLLLQPRRRRRPRPPPPLLLPLLLCLLRLSRRRNRRGARARPRPSPPPRRPRRQRRRKRRCRRRRC